MMNSKSLHRQRRRATSSPRRDRRAPPFALTAHRLARRGDVSASRATLWRNPAPQSTTRTRNDDDDVDDDSIAIPRARDDERDARAREAVHARPRRRRGARNEPNQCARWDDDDVVDERTARADASREGRARDADDERDEFSVRGVTARGNLYRDRGCAGARGGEAGGGARVRQV